MYRVLCQYAISAATVKYLAAAFLYIQKWLTVKNPDLCISPSIYTWWGGLPPAPTVQMPSLMIRSLGQDQKLANHYQR